MPLSLRARVRRRVRPPAAALRVIRLNNGFQLLFNLLWWMPVFYQYQRQAGLSDSQIFGIQSVYYVAFCLLEIPTGFIADRIGQRRCMQLGAAAMTAANLLPVLSPSFAGFMAHFLAIAAARSLVSGASSAYLYEYLHEQGADAHYVQAEGTARALGLWAKIMCWPLVGVLMHVRHEAPYVLTALSALGSLACAAALPPLAEPPLGGTRPPAERVGLLASARQAVKVLGTSRSLGPLMVQGVAVFTLARICQVNLFQPLLLEKNLPVADHGAVLSAMTVAEAVGSARTGWLRSRLSDTTVVTVLSVIMALTLAATTLSGGLGTILWLCVFAAAAGLAYPVQRNLINAAIPPTPYRATLLSVESIIDRGVCALVALAVGAYLAADRLDALLVHAAAGTCLLLLVVGVVLGRLRRDGARPATGQA
ncbi:MFS transporter [Streptomyces sp. NBC_00664]|uniref:MFS transporter n=1 Tax=Streptomyces sp. NBC_00664 TaxID=2975802 RepID=UPI002E36AE63|nr:MFS transporter [Streptomyces sp. NBC_00664]